ncbi:MAG: hypothetical protein ACP5O0_06320 [Acidimicrobiales bacterium]
MSPDREFSQLFQALIFRSTQRLIMVAIGVGLGFLLFGFIDLITTPLAFPVAASLIVLIGSAAALYRISDAKNRSSYDAHPSQR